MIEITDDQPGEWDKLGVFGVVPDPMILRTAELFLNGRSGCSGAHMDPDDVWSGIDKNVRGLLAFFDMLLTRERVPYIHTLGDLDVTGIEVAESSLLTVC